MRIIKKWLRVYCRPVLFLILIIEVSAFILAYYYHQSGNWNNFLTVSVQALLTLLATFAGIFTPLQIERNLKKEDDRRILKFALSFLSSELRSNLHVLKQLKSNYTFSAILKNVPGDENKIFAIENKFRSVEKQLKLVSFESYYAIQNSNAANTIDGDEYYNSIMQTYENLKLLTSAVTVASSDTKLKKFLFSQTFDPLTQDEATAALSSVEEQLSQSYAELEFSIKLHKKCIKEIQDKLSSLGIKTSLEKRGIIKNPELP